MFIDGELWFSDWGQWCGTVRSNARIQGLVKALLAVFRARGLEPTETQRARIERCRSSKQLLTWIERAATASTVGKVFRPGRTNPPSQTGAPEGPLRDLLTWMFSQIGCKKLTTGKASTTLELEPVDDDPPP